MKVESAKINQFKNLINYYENNKVWFNPFSIEYATNMIDYYEKGSKIKIKKKNKGKFTEYCGGNVTSECISRGKNSPDPKIRKRATFAANARLWNKKK